MTGFNNQCNKPVIDALLIMADETRKNHYFTRSGCLPAEFDNRFTFYTLVLAVYSALME